MTSTPSVLEWKSAQYEPSFFERKDSAQWRRALHFLKEIIVARALLFWNEIMDRHAAAPFIC